MNGQNVLNVGLDLDGTVWDTQMYIISKCDEYFKSHGIKQSLKTVEISPTVKDMYGLDDNKLISDIEAYVFKDYIEYCPFNRGFVKSIQNLNSLRTVDHEKKLVAIHAICGRDGEVETMKKLSKYCEIDTFSFNVLHKGNKCKELGIDVMIDDEIKNIKSCAKYDIPTITFRRPYNMKLIGDNCTLYLNDWIDVSNSITLLALQKARISTDKLKYCIV